MAGSHQVRLSSDTAQVMANNSLQEGGGRQGQDQAIASPCDIVYIGQGAFAIAMAGSHQVRFSTQFMANNSLQVERVTGARKGHCLSLGHCQYWPGSHCH